MRKERYWSSSGGRSSSSSKRREQEKKVCSFSNGGTTTTTTVGGCMSAMFQLFDFHLPSHHTQSSFRFTSSSIVVDEQTKPTGIEAPRNSLEVDESPLSSSSSNPKREDSLTLKMGIQIKTKSDKRDSVCSEVSSSPGTRTPTLVARLMGLDLLPDSTSSSPKPSSTNGSTPNSLPSHRTHRARHLLRGRKSCSDMESGSRSVPETPKVSLSRRSDVDHYHRPSINKENTDFDLSRLIRKQVKSSDEEGLSPGHYARQIVKQVKETVSRRSGMSDITNMVRRDQLVISNQSKNKKLSKAAELDSGSSPSCSPRLRFLETNYKNRHYHEVTQPEAPQRYPKAAAQVASDKLAKRRSTETAAEVVMRNRLQEETYVRPSPTAKGGNVVLTDRRCKKTTPLSSGMRSIGGGGGGGGGGVPTVFPIKKDPSPPATKIPVKQQTHDAPQTKYNSHLSTCSKTRHRQAVRTHDCDRLIPTTVSSSSSTATTTTTVKLAELQYVSSIFKCIGIDLDRNVPLPSSFTSPFIFSPNLSKPSILDDFQSRNSFLSLSEGLVGLKCNQKLLLDLVEELLFGFFKPYRNFDLRVSPISRYRQYGHVTLGVELVDDVITKVKSFPRANCQVLEDIDGIIDKDLPQCDLKTRSTAVEEEGGDMVVEIERHVWNGLMQELAAM